MGVLGWGGRLHGTESTASLEAVTLAALRGTEAGGQSLATRDATWIGAEKENA